MKLQNWEGVLDDCLKAIDKFPRNNSAWKAYFQLAQAQLGLRRPNEALNSALTAYHFSLEIASTSTQSISDLVRRAKKEKWEKGEHERLIRQNLMYSELQDRLLESRIEELKEVEDRLERGEIGRVEAREEKELVEKRAEVKVEDLKNLFAIADVVNMERRVSLQCL